MQILTTIFISFLLKVNEKGFKLGLQIEVTTLKVIYIYIYNLSFHCVSILFFHSHLEDYFAWHMFI
jgi:hypothetical protein